MSNERDSAHLGRDMDAEAVASRQGVPIEQAKDAVEKTAGGREDAEKAAAGAKARNTERRGR